MENKLNTIGINYQDLMERLGNNESIVERFLKKFINDHTFEHIQQDLEGHDYDSLLRDVHSLKGISGNLSMTSLYQITDMWVADLRAENFQTSEKLYQETSLEYTKIIHGLKAFYQV